MEQDGLFDAHVTRDEHGRPRVTFNVGGDDPTLTLEERFDAWIADNPYIYREVVRLAREWKAAGHERGSISMIWERLRWEFGVRGDDGDYSLNNIYRAPMARRVMEREPDLTNFFETRRSQVDA